MGVTTGRLLVLCGCVFARSCVEAGPGLARALASENLRPAFVGYRYCQLLWVTPILFWS